jgi:hypothetical protein
MQARVANFAQQVEAEVRGLEAMDLVALREAWEHRFGPPPKQRSPELIRLHLAWRIQAAAFGSLDADTRARLRRSSKGATAADRMEVGSQLTREWLGERHQVTVVSGGYLYAGRTWKSLSSIARSITGARWNGPRFFGLRGSDG